MKNIHVLPTEKPSKGYIIGECIKALSDVKIGQFVKTYYLMFDEEYFQPHNIYIISDEKFKDEDYFLHIAFDTVHTNGSEIDSQYCKKIILTTDQDLIKDGVQAIDDEFLEWFVKNPSCEKVEIRNKYISQLNKSSIEIYKIIIPKEDTKQETLEEASEYYSHNYFDMHETNNYKALKQGFEAGAKWQQERMYSYEEVLEQLNLLYSMKNSLVDTFTDENDYITMKWFEQFKKK